MEKNYYQLFAVAPTAGADEIKKSYTILSNKYKPDVYSTEHDADEKALKNINHIYEVLSDPEKRKQYDLKLQTIEAKEEQAHIPSFVVDENNPTTYVSNDPFSPVMGIKTEQTEEVDEEKPIKLSENYKWILRLIAISFILWRIIHRYVN